MHRRWIIKGVSFVGYDVICKLFIQIICLISTDVCLGFKPELVVFKVDPIPSQTGSVLSQ